MKYINRFSAYHVIASFLLYVIFYSLSLNILWSAIGSFSFGLAREIYDHYKLSKNTLMESTIDLLANVAGIGLAVWAVSYAI